MTDARRDFWSESIQSLICEKIISEDSLCDKIVIRHTISIAT